MKALILLFVILSSLQARKPQPPRLPPGGPQVLSLAPNSWILSGAFFGRSTNPSALSGGGFYFNFPDRSTGRYAGYLMTGVRPLAGGAYLTLTLRVVTTGAPIFKYDSEPGNTCVTPATVRPYFEKAGTSEFDRWWSNPVAYTLAAGTITLTIPLTPDQWSSLYGKRGTDSAAAMAGWIQALQATNQIGMTFGGGCFYGHGVSVAGGTAQFQVLAYSTF